MICFLLSCALPSQSQKLQLMSEDKLYIDSLYQDKSAYLLFSNVLQFDSLKKDDLMKAVKNWAAASFVSLKEVLVGETDDQLVFNYVDKSYFVKSLGMKTYVNWYIRLVCQFKDGKMKCSFYDDKNAYNQGIGTRTFYLSSYFKDSDGSQVARNPDREGLVALYQNTAATFSSINKAITSKSNADF